MFIRLLSVSASALVLSCVSATPDPATTTGEGGSANAKGGSSAVLSGQNANKGGASSASSGKPGSGGSSGKSSAKSSPSTSQGGSSAAEGGKSSSEGGDTATEGGESGVTGGASTSGGKSSTGGKTGKTGTGGKSSTGGKSNTSGTDDSGGATTSTGGATTSTGGEAPKGDVYNPDFVEFYGKDCDAGEPKEASSSSLPDLFEFFDGSRMSKKSDWKCRRAELQKAVEKYIEGTKPGKPEKVTGTVSSSSIKVHVENNGKTADFSVSVSLPGGGSGPVPAIIGLGGGNLDASILKSEGVATINFSNYSTIASETARSGVFATVTGSSGTSATVGWGWAVSRMIDVLVDERDAGRNNIIDPTAIGITGCSRLGKGAFIIGAFDERIALGIPHESGTGGVSAFRVVNTSPTGPNGKPAQSLDSAWSEAQGWFGSTFGSYKGKVNSIPVDTHSIVAMYAPRGLLVLDNSRIGELCSTCEHAASAAGALVYKALGVEGNIAYHGGNASDPHNHCQFYASQAEPLKQAIRAHLTKKAKGAGKIEPAAVTKTDLAKWIDWEAPTLADDISFDSPPVTAK